MRICAFRSPLQRIRRHDEGCSFTAFLRFYSEIEGLIAFESLNARVPVKMSKKHVTLQYFMALFSIRNG
jgi:hypothetical protein